jgi:hypothetical protein
MSKVAFIDLRPILLFWAPIIVILGFLIASFRRSPNLVRSRFWWLAILPACWIFVGLWGGYYSVDVTSGVYSPNPSWVLWPISNGWAVYLALAVLLVAFMPQGRFFAALFAALNLYLMLAISFLAGMAVTGQWL